MKAVAVLVQNYYDVDVRVRRKAEALVGAGYVVDVLALRHRNSDPATYTLEGVNVHTMALGKHRGSLFRYGFEYLAFFLWASWKLLLLMRKRRYAVVDINTLPDFLVFAAVSARWMGAKIVLDMHEITPEFYMSKYGIKADSVMVRILTLIERLSFRFADRVITINEPIEKLLVRRGLTPSKSLVVMNSVDEEAFTRANPELRQDGAGGDKKFIMMYHGTLTRLYGLDIAIEALAMVLREMPTAELWILGDGPERRPLQQLAKQRGLASEVKFIGSVLPQDIPGWLSRCDIGVLPTRQDVFLDFSFSNKLSEYIVMGKPAIVARLKAIHHYFSERALAYFEPNNPVDLARQMERMYREPGSKACLAETARLEYEPIRWGVMRERYLGLMDELTRARAFTR